MHMALFVGLCCSHFSYFCFDFAWWCWGDRSHTLSFPVIHRPVVHPTMSPLPPLVASSAANTDDLAVIASGPLRLVVALVQSLTLEEPTSEEGEVPVLVMPGADGASQGTTIVEMDGAGPRLGADAKGLLRDLVR
jgi:hypothetical protein